MKRLITLIISAALFSPLGAVAATNTPSIVGPLLWGFNMPSGQTAMSGSVWLPVGSQLTRGFSAVSYFYVNVLAPQNNEGFFSLAGYAHGINGPDSADIPVTGTMIPSDSNYQYTGSTSASIANYIVNISYGPGAGYTCIVAPDTLNGNCTSLYGGGEQRTYPLLFNYKPPSN